jgi:hypothetical protein
MPLSRSSVRRKIRLIPVVEDDTMLKIICIAATLGAQAMKPDPAEPIRLEIRASADSVDLTVVGNGPLPDDARFTLEVESQGKGGTTKTAQSGTERAGGARGTLLRSRIVTSGLTGWSARLTVTIGARAYTMERSG